MKRLTEEHPGWIDDEFWTAAREPDDEEITDVYLKLKAYEDTGLEPEAFQAVMQEFANHQMELTYYWDIGNVEGLRISKEAEQKRWEGCGHWEEICSSVYLGIHYYACSMCHEAALRDEIGAQVLSNLCPHCGRDLRGESHDED